MSNVERPSIVLVTGAAGLIGSSVCRLLLERGVRIVACDNFSIGAWRGEGKNIVWENMDLAARVDFGKFYAHGIEAVIHCAAHPGGRSLEEPSADVLVNAYGSMQIFEWCAKKKIPVVYLSSSVIYGDQPAGLIQEWAPLKPMTVYGVCKLACESYLKVLEQGYGLKWLAARLFATYGAGHKPSKFQGIVNVMLTQLMEGDKVVVKGSLDRTRDMIYVDDSARAIVDLLLSGHAWGKAVNVGTGSAITIREMIRIIAELLGKSYDLLEIMEADSTVGDPFYNVPDISLLQQLTGFKPSHDLRSGIQELLRQRATGASVAH